MAAMAAMEAAAGTPVATGLVARRLLVVTLLCAALATAMPSKNKEGNEAVATNSATAETGSECVSGHSKIDGGSDCGGYCYCLGGQWVCPECVNEGPIKGTKKLRAEDLEPLPLRRSKRVPLDGERCAPGVTYMDECNTCICSQDGIKAHASCTFKVCPK